MDVHARLTCNRVRIAFYVEEASPHILYQEGFVVGKGSISLYTGYPLGMNDTNAKLIESMTRKSKDNFMYWKS